MKHLANEVVNVAAKADAGMITEIAKNIKKENDSKQELVFLKMIREQANDNPGKIKEILGEELFDFMMKNYEENVDGAEK